MIGKILSVLLLGYSTVVFAESQFDRSLINAAIINEKYEIIDRDEFNEIMRHVTNEVAVTLPRQVDVDTQLLSMIVSRPLISQTYTLRNIETKKDLSDKVELSDFNQWIKNYTCTSELGSSQVYRVNGTKFSLKVINSRFIEIYSYTFPLKTCTE